MPVERVFKDHRTAEIFGVKDLQVLTDPDFLYQKALSFAGRLKLTKIGEFIYPFEPREGEEKGGITLIFAISESHLAIHTWAGERYMHIDAFSCSQETNMKYFKRFILKEFPGEEIKTRKIRY